VDQGSRFWFEVPAVIEEGDVPAALESQADALISGYDGPRRRVLVVDDVPVNREVVREMLTPLGFIVDMAADGAGALAAIARARPDFVLLDLRMAPMTGKETIERLRADVATRDLKVVAFSASTIGFTRADALRLGCDDYLSKPFREEELLVLIERHLGLQWRRAAGSEAQVAAPTVEHPTPAQAAELLALARQGDAAGLRESLQRMLAANPGLDDFAARIGELAARFQMQEIRNRLEALLNDAK
jgi:CheY-like chemotaxis protein